MSRWSQASEKSTAGEAGTERERERERENATAMCVPRLQILVTY